VTGLALEPSWLAHQLNMLYLPFWLAATIRGETAHAHRLWKLSLENALLAGGLLVLYLSLSRVGLLAFLLMVAFLILFANLKLIAWIQRRIGGKEQSRKLSVRVKQYGITLVLILALLLIYAGLLFGIGYVLSKVDYRMARLFDLSLLRETSFIRYANQLVIAERIVFWQAGWEAFNRFPVLGVGLGNAGFFFAENLSPYAWALTEVRLVMYHLSNLPNIKSLWVRLLAETGLVGFALFLGWCYTIWVSARYLRGAASRFLQAIGWAGSFVLVGLLVEGFSVDTFALPYFWVSFGLLVAASRTPMQIGE
jgi:O-antigen ligase